MGNTEEREVHGATEELLRRLAARTTPQGPEQQAASTVVYVLGNHNVIYCGGGASCPNHPGHEHKG